MKLNLRCTGSPRIGMSSPNILAPKVSEISAIIRTDGHGKIDKTSDPELEYIYFIGSETLPSAYYILSDDSSILFYSTGNRYRKHNLNPKVFKHNEQC